MPAVLAGTIAALVLAVNPRDFAISFARLDLRFVPVIVGLAVAFFVMQGLRWHILLATVGARLRVRGSVLVNTAGQAITAILPLGEAQRSPRPRITAIGVGAGPGDVADNVDEHLRDTAFGTR